MGVNVVLLSKSEIIKKMLSHCLYYQAVEIHRFESLEALRDSSVQPDVFFIDLDLKAEAEVFAQSARREMGKVPLIALYRKGEEAEAGGMPNRIQKPIEANSLRKMVASLVPKVSRSKIHQFLKYPKSEMQNITAGLKPKKEMKSKTDSQKTPPAKSFDMGKPEAGDEDLIIKGEGAPPRSLGADQAAAAPASGGSFDMGKPEAGDEDLIIKGEGAPPRSLGADQAAAAPASGGSFDMGKPEAGDEDLIAKGAGGEASEKDLESEPSDSNFKGADLKEEKKVSIPSSDSSHSSFLGAALNKEEINLDENTQNDFAPMAMKSSPVSMEKPDKPLDGDLRPAARVRDEDIVRALNEYKGTLEFETLMEKSLNRYGRDMAQKILAQDNQDLMQSALAEFKETESFKQMMTKALQEYVRERSVFREAFERALQDFVGKRLPAMAKEIVEREIQKIFKEEEV